MAGMVVTASMGVMNSLLKKLTALLGDEYKLLKGARDEVASLRDEMSSMGALLARMDGMEALDAQQAEWRRKVREMSYDMEDCVDLFMRRFGDGAGGGNSKAVGGLVAQLRMLWSRHNLARKIQKLKARVEDESRRRGRYRLLDDHAARGNQQPSASPVTMDPRISALYEEATALVGIDASLRKAIGWLTDEEEGEGARRQQLRVVSIVGFGGIGKSTLARRAYNETRGQFDCSAFVSVSRSPNTKRIFADILSGVGSQCDVSTDSEHQLIDKLREHLQDKRYLIVIDDIWSENAWKIISCAFVENYRRSRVITTTRHQNVASACLHTRNFHGHVHRVEPLNNEDSRRLFFRRVFNSEDCPEDFQTTSEQILKKCGGVPLAIISLASTLACQNNVMVIETWEKMLNSLCYRLETSPSLEWMRHVLDLSYKDLCPNLRACMLYLGIFPEDWVISKDDLVRRWIAEGFVCDAYGHVPEEIAEGYFIELINRSIIQVAEFNEYNEAISCRVHDIMLDFIISKATEDNFFAIVGTADQQHIRTGNPSIRRVSFRIDHMECDRVRLLGAQSSSSN
ncbi:putative disease resistance RPP13-like protein 3 [Panicum hallii]|uniref:putative disease resistance RPP13-like protein 3 n=1 Tax=Panicum hallii TaxID=206008 RepID=UPI000DF4E7D6|nr:putative disease resistance RPP13-like protein 3 [Panicum hallii]